MTNKIAIAVHGGAGPDSDFIKKNKEGYREGIEEAIRIGYKILEDGGSSLDAVETAVRFLEDNPLFNAGRGSVLSKHGEVEMEASIMNGKDLSCGAVAVVKNVKNPISLAKAVMEKTEHVYLGGPGTLEFAQEVNAEFQPDDYFITQYNYDEYKKFVAQQNQFDHSKMAGVRKEHGTVGAVALDRNGNMAAATSTGGLENKRRGRIADSSVIGAGSYANNFCAVSTTGDGEYMIQYVASFHVAALMEYKALALKDACSFLVHEKCKNINGDIGLIAVDKEGNVSIEFNTERMHRGWRTSNEELKAFTYPDEV
jgi:L-asparaginase / beta-aspartyl-peptidase